MPITHKWNGTILTITSDSGTSSADLKGEKGDDGARGAQGAPGDCVATDTALLGGVAADKYALKTYVDNAVSNVDVDLSAYATQEYVNKAIPSLDGYATKTYVNSAIPSLEGYATQQYVNNAIPSLDGYATQEYVNNAIPSLGDYATKQYAKGMVAHNLLDNSDFRNPINQRGQTTYKDNGYTVDRWEVYSGTVSIASDYIATSGQMYQKIATPTNKVYTFAIENDAGIAMVTGIPANGIISTSLGNATIKLATIDEYTEVVIEPAEGHTIAGAYWAALYEGEYTIETLPPYVPKGYTAELAECQRYYYRVGDNITRFSNPISGKYGIQGSGVIINLPITMRIIPTATIAYDINDGDEKTATPLWITKNTLSLPAIDINAGEFFDLHWVEASADL